MSNQQFPPGWNRKRVEDLIRFYETQSDEEALAEDESAAENADTTLMEIPVELVPEVRDLLAKRAK